MQTFGGNAAFVLGRRAFHRSIGGAARSLGEPKMLSRLHHHENRRLALGAHGGTKPVSLSAIGNVLRTVQGRRQSNSPKPRHPVFSAAKQRLPDKIREYRSRYETVKAFAVGRMTVGDVVEACLRKVRDSVLLKPRSKDYRQMMMDFIRRSWPSLLGTDVRRVTEGDCKDCLVRYQQHYSPSIVNNSIGTLRAIFDEAIRTGARFNNPAAGLSRMKIRQKRLELTSREEFLRFVVNPTSFQPRSSATM